MNYLSSFCYAYFFSRLQFVCKCFHIPDIWNGKLTALTPDHMIRICVFFSLFRFSQNNGLEIKFECILPGYLPLLLKALN